MGNEHIFVCQRSAKGYDGLWLWWIHCIKSPKSWIFQCDPSALFFSRKFGKIVDKKNEFFLEIWQNFSKKKKWKFQKLEIKAHCTIIPQGIKLTFRGKKNSSKILGKIQFPRKGKKFNWVKIIGFYFFCYSKFNIFFFHIFGLFRGNFWEK